MQDNDTIAQHNTTNYTIAQQNTTNSTEDVWKAVYTAYNITAWTDEWDYRRDPGSYYTCCANGVGPGPHEVYGKRMKTDNPLFDLGYHHKRTTMTWKQWVDKLRGVMAPVTANLVSELRLIA